jgi:hypothetical protein
MKITFLNSQEYGAKLRATIAALGSDATTEGAVAFLHKEGFYKDLRTKEDFEKGVKPESKYPELAEEEKKEAKK